MTNTNISVDNYYPSISFVEAVKLALDKFPRIRNPIVRARLQGREANSSVQKINAKVYYRAPSLKELPEVKAKRVKRELLDAGVTIYGLIKAESRYLPIILHDHEHIEAVIYGQHNASSAMMIATDERIIYLDKKPMVEMFDEVSYEVISGIEFDIHVLFATIVLHTPVRNYDFRFVNLRCAEKFARHIEKHRLEREPKDHAPVKEKIIEIQPGVQRTRYPIEDRGINDMSGYYWLPSDEEERRKIQQAIT